MANKKGPLTIAEKFYIVQNPHSRTDEELAAEMGRTVKTIQKIMKDAKVPEEIKKDTGCVTESKPSGKTRELMLRKTAGKRKGVSIMTKEASEHADDTRSQRLEKPIVNRPERYSDAGIAKIFPDED